MFLQLINVSSLKEGRKYILSHITFRLAPQLFNWLLSECFHHVCIWCSCLTRSLVPAVAGCGPFPAAGSMHQLSDGKPASAPTGDSRVLWLRGARAWDLGWEQQSGRCSALVGGPPPDVPAFTSLWQIPACGSTSWGTAL